MFCCSCCTLEVNPVSLLFVNLKSSSEFPEKDLLATLGLKRFCSPYKPKLFSVGRTMGVFNSLKLQSGSVLLPQTLYQAQPPTLLKWGRNAKTLDTMSESWPSNPTCFCFCRKQYSMVSCIRGASELCQKPNKLKGGLEKMFWWYHIFWLHRRSTENYTILPEQGLYRE